MQRIQKITYFELCNPEKGAKSDRGRNRFEYLQPIFLGPPDPTKKTINTLPRENEGGKGGQNHLGGNLFGTEGEIPNLQAQTTAKNLLGTSHYPAM